MKTSAEWSEHFNVSTATAGMIQRDALREALELCEIAERNGWGAKWAAKYIRERMPVNEEGSIAELHRQVLKELR